MNKPVFTGNGWTITAKDGSTFSVGWAWLSNNDGCAFSRNRSSEPVNVIISFSKVKTNEEIEAIYELPSYMRNFSEEISSVKVGSATYGNDAVSMARKYITDNNLRGEISSLCSEYNDSIDKE